MLLDIAMLLLGVILTAGTFIFVSAEFSLVALDQAVVESRAAAGDARARQVGEAIKNLSTQLSGSQVGITLTTILLGYTTQSALADLLTKAGVGLGLSTAISSAVGVGVAAVIINVMSMVFGELVPRRAFICTISIRISCDGSPLCPRRDIGYLDGLALHEFHPYN